jgi:O-antigen/teichoic acid export membrane protein
LKFNFNSLLQDKSDSAGISYERFRRIFLTGGSTALVKIFSAVINLVTVPLTVKYLGAERYGLWLGISSIMALMSFADLGLGNGLLNAISKAHGEKNYRDAARAVSSTFFLLIGIAGFLALLFRIVYPFFEWQNLFNAQSSLAIQESGPTVTALVVLFLINMPLGVVRRVQEGLQEGYIFQSWLILGSIISLMGLLVCIYFEVGLPWLVVFFSGGQLVATLINGYYLFYRKHIDLRPRIRYFDLNSGLKLMKTGMLFFLLGIFTLLGNTSDDIIIAHTVSTGAIAGYEIVKKLFLFSMFAQFIIQPLWPAFGEALASGDYQWAANTLKKAIKLGVISTALLSLPLLIFGKQLINIWVGVEYIPSWGLLLGFYCFVVFATYGGVISTFLNHGPLLRKQLLIVGLASSTSVVLKIIFSLKYGTTGIVWATLVGYLIFFIIPSYRIAFTYLNNILPKE